MKRVTKSEAINPSHYKQGSMEVIDAIEGLGLDGDFCLGNVLKYIARSKHKGSELTDLGKAMWYLKRKISRVERGGASRA